MKKVGSVFLVLTCGTSETQPELLDALSDEREIGVFEQAVEKGVRNPLEKVYESRNQMEAEDEEFGDYVEQLLCQPFLRPEIREHGVQWFRSKVKIDEYKRNEREAAQVIAGYAYKVFLENPSKTDFMLAGPKAMVRVQVVQVPSRDEKAGNNSDRRAA